MLQLLSRLERNELLVYSTYIRLMEIANKSGLQRKQYTQLKIYTNTPRYSYTLHVTGHSALKNTGHSALKKTRHFAMKTGHPALKKTGHSVLEYTGHSVLKTSDRTVLLSAYHT